MKIKNLSIKLSVFLIMLLCFVYFYENISLDKGFNHEEYAKAHHVEDLIKYPQNLIYYAGKLPLTPLLSEEEMQKYEEDFYKKYFRPWKQEKSFISFETVSNSFKNKNFSYAENLKPWDSIKWKKLQENANLENFPNTSQKGISINQSPLRALPSLTPLFLEPEGLSDAYPFDMLQYSHLPLALPLYISHVSKDKAWYFVETGNSAGWVQSKDIAIIDEEFIGDWQKFELIAIVKEGSVLEINSKFYNFASIGTLLPSKEGNVYAPIYNINEATKLYPVEIAQTSYKNFPLDYTAFQVAELGQEMMGQVYGWGGFLGNRDCSLMLQDLFISFGIYLPRNSALQGKVGSVISFKDKENIEKLIAEKAKPFASLIYKKGHIMLYIGQENSKSMMFHSAWGIVAESNERIVLGKTAITSLQVGQDNPRADKTKSLYNTIESINNF